MKFLRFSCLLAALTIVVATFPVVAQEQQTSRDQWQRAEDVFRELGISDGSHVADLGAGGGWFTRRLAKAVGPQGRVYAVDVNPVTIRELRESLPADLTNIEIVRAEENDPKLPTGQLDAVLIVNAYHEFHEYAAVLAKIREALKPGGRLVLVEPAPLRAEDATRAAQVKRHQIAIEFAEADLAQAGFEIVKKDLAFVKRPAHQTEGVTHAPVDWLLVARRPNGNQPF
ncbi:MAG TPA: methyltransferase domain-containing protein [Vicinamibacterales bacterium]|nr:methyltransferase domain-containing protein [Vicinamibacterales bacterium]